MIVEFNYISNTKLKRLVILIIDFLSSQIILYTNTNNTIISQISPIKMNKLFYAILLLLLSVAAATDKVCDPTEETCIYDKPIKKSFISRLVFKFWGGVSSGKKSMADFGHGTAQTAETAAVGTAEVAGLAYGAVSKATIDTASAISQVASDTVNSIAGSVGTAARVIDEWITSTRLCDVKKSLAKDCKRELVHELLRLKRSEVDKHPKWGKKGDSNYGFCRSIIEKAFEKAKDMDPSKEVCQFYEHVKETYLEECASRGIPESKCKDFADHTAKSLLKEKEQNCAEGYVTIVRC